MGEEQSGRVGKRIETASMTRLESTIDTWLRQEFGFNRTPFGKTESLHGIDAASVRDDVSEFALYIHAKRSGATTDVTMTQNGRYKTFRK